MITLGKLLTELKPESLNEIIAAGGCKSKTKKNKGRKGGKCGRGGGSSDTTKGCKSITTKSTNSYSCS